MVILFDVFNGVIIGVTTKITILIKDEFSSREKTAKYVFYELNRTLSSWQFFRTPKTEVLIERKQINCTLLSGGSVGTKNVRQYWVKAENFSNPKI